MLEDRNYMRRPSFGPQRSATVVLVIVTVLAFIVQKILETSSSFPVRAYLYLSLDGLKHGYVWQLLSFQFLHSNLLHLAGNCLVIFFLGRPVEDALGRKSFLTLYFTSGIVGGLCQILAGVLASAISLQPHASYFSAPVVGASAGGFGITAAFALLFPDQILLLFMIIPMRAKYLLLLSIALAAWGVVLPNNSPFGQHVADVAHLGGILAGFIFVKYAVHWHFQWPQLNRRARPPIRRLVKVHSHKPGWGRDKAVVEEDMPADEFLSKEVDPILDKITAQGIQSLTERERRILETARSKMGKR
jgi:membrane associated rhomboid family serine protease